MRSQVLLFDITIMWRFGDNLRKKWKPTNNYSEYNFQIFSDKVFQWALWSFTKSGWFLTFNLSTYFKSMSHFIRNIFRKYSIRKKYVWNRFTTMTASICLFTVNNGNIKTSYDKSVPRWQKNTRRYDAAKASIFTTGTVLLTNTYLATTKINHTQNWQCSTVKIKTWKN